MAQEDLGAVQEAVAAWVAKQRWTFARTMPQWPHEYVARDRIAPADQAMFNSAAALIAAAGYDARWGGRTYRYLDIGPHQYWVMGCILNRALRKGAP